jgi:hypothetical protein
MLRRWTLVAAAVGAAALFAGPALAATEISINPGNVANGGVLAKDVEQGCDFGGGPVAGKDVWVFVLPGNHDTSGDFLSVTAFFDSDGNATPDKEIHIDADGGGFANGGPSTSKAFIALPAGWRLISATAEITGTADSFNLTHTCKSPTSPQPSTSPSTSPAPSHSPSPSQSPESTPTPSVSASGSPSESASAAPSTAPSQSPTTSAPTPTTPAASPSSGGGLPITGTSAVTQAVFAIVLIVAGTLAVLVSRRRRSSGMDEVV